MFELRYPFKTCENAAIRLSFQKPSWVKAHLYSAVKIAVWRNRWTCLTDEPVYSTAASRIGFYSGVSLSSQNSPPIRQFNAMRCLQRPGLPERRKNVTGTSVSEAALLWNGVWTAMMKDSFGWGKGCPLKFIGITHSRQTTMIVRDLQLSIKPHQML